MQSPPEIIETDAMIYDGNGTWLSQVSLLLPAGAQHVVVDGKRYTVERYEVSEDGDRVFLNPCEETPVEVMRDIVVPTKAERIQSMVAPMKVAAKKRAAGKQPAPKKRSAAKTEGPAVPKKRIAKNVKDRAWQLQLILGFEERPGPRDLPTDKNILLRELFAELDQLYQDYPTLKRENQLWL